MNLIIVDTRDTFLSDLQIAAMLEDADIVFEELLTNSSNIQNILSKKLPDAIVVAENALSQQEDWLFPGCTVIGYRTRKDSDNPFLAYKIPSYPYTATGQLLLERLANGFPSLQTTPEVVRKEPEEAAQVVKSAETKLFDEAACVSNADAVTVSSSKNQEPPTPSPRTEDEKTVTAASTVRAVLDNTAKQAQKHNESEAIKDWTAPKKTTKVVTVYSAKGGVGKTTISTELAVYLSRISQGRGLLRVCIVDCNIDFGDVLMTLKYNPDGPNLSYWAAEVRERLANGESAETITYTRDEIEKKLQKHPETGLYALIAPITHEDSMDIEPEDMNIILDNIINYGEFDFVICDTGNNTRDASVYALFKADEVLLVGAQDINAASCNIAFINTMQKIKFDISKIKLVINKILPYKTTEIAIEELEQMFSYPCLARIKHSTDIVRANNCSEPIVLNDKGHNLTKEIRNIAEYLLAHTPVEAPKPSFFKRIFKKR